MKNIHKNIIAKTIESNDKTVPGISVFAHTLIVGIVAQELIKILPKTFVEKYELVNYPFVISLHDIGKACPGFQEQLLLSCGMSKFKTLDDIKSKYVTCHEQVSTEYLKNCHRKMFETPDCMLSFIRWHHGKYRNQKQEWSDDDFDVYGDGSWNDIRNDIFVELEKFFGYSKEFFQKWKYFRKLNFKQCVTDPDVKYMMGLLSVCDWIGSDEKQFDPIKFLSDDIDVEYIRACAKNALDEYGFGKININENLSFQEIFDGYTPNNIQKTLGDIVTASGVYVVEAPMGYGKTEAAEYAAYKCLISGIVDGVYFALPTQTTSNSIFSRYKKFVQKISDINEYDIRLAHSKSVFHESNSGMNSWYTGKRSILSPFALGTVDQALMSVVGSIKHFFLRSFGLARKCVIIDEVHSYDTYTKNLNVRMIKDLIELECVVILLSATLTKKSRYGLCGDDIDIDKYPLITKVVGDVVSYHHFKQLLENKTIGVKMLSVDNEKSKQSKFISSRMSALIDVVDRVKSGQLVLWIENTVNESREVYDFFNSRIECGLLNSRFTSKDRELQETKWIERFGKNSKRESGWVLVSTQVCEQSVDIDADYLVTALCPTDMLFQRIGRLQRHKIESRNINPECLILTSDFYNVADKETNLETFRNKIGPSSYVYFPYVLRKTHNLWKNISNVNIPGDIRKLLERTYDNTDDEFGVILKRSMNFVDSQDYRKSLNATTSTYGLESDDNGTNVDEEYSTRNIKIPVVDVILLSKNDNPNFVNIYGEEFQLSKVMRHRDRKNINDSSIKLQKSFVDKNSDIFQKVVVGKFEYYVCLVGKNGSIRNYSTGQISQHSYTDGGFF